MFQRARGILRATPLAREIGEERLYEPAPDRNRLLGREVRCRRARVPDEELGALLRQVGQVRGQPGAQAANRPS